ncbi:hypothetical protein HN51_028612 [Arachis hypogaea]
MLFSSKTRLEASSASLLLKCKKRPEDSAPSGSGAGQGFWFLFLLLLRTTSYLLEIGTREAIILWRGHNLPFPDGLIINGRGWNGITFTVHQGNTYRLRISNVGLTTSINMRIQGHKMKLVEVEGSHTIQNTYSFLDIHLGQTYSIDQPPKDYYIVVFTRFTRRVLTTKHSASP